jgi:tRNA (guanosine-2'-O-)-methyltransferase
MKRDIDFHSQFVTDHKKQRIEEVLKYRTNHITVALEDIYQPQNASAVLRSCDCFGVQKVHIIENKNSYKINPDVTMGCEKWLDLVYYNDKGNNSLDCMNDLKNKGYLTVATTLEKVDTTLEDLPLDKPIALFFGSEKDGLTNDIIGNADIRMKIPMYGFSQSFNISVSAAITLHHLNLKLQQSEIKWQLSEEEKTAIRLDWFKKINGIENRLLNN